MFHNIKSTKDKMLETNLNLESSKDIHPAAEKMLAPCHVFYDKMKAGTIQTTHDKFLIIHVSNVLYYCAK